MARVERSRPKLVVLGPTPPPHHGMTTFTRMLLESQDLAAAYEVIHVDTSDRRGLDNMGRLDAGNVRLALIHAWRLCRVLARHHPDIVLVQVSQNAWAYVRDATFIALAKGFGARVLTHLNGGGFRSFYGSAPAIVRALVRATSRRLDGAAVLGRGLLPTYDGLVPRERLHILPNGVADDWAGKPKRTAADPMVVAYLGMLIESKGYLDLMAAAERLRAREARIHFRFAGPWWSEQEERVGRERAQELSAVELVGVVTGDAKRRFLAEADVLALPTRYPPEGQPQAVLEAMAAGLPVVATARGAIADMVVDGETGILIPERDPDALVDALERLSRDPALRHRMSVAARAKYEAEFTAERCVQRLVRILDSILGTKQDRSFVSPEGLESMGVTSLEG